MVSGTPIVTGCHLPSDPMVSGIPALVSGCSVRGSTWSFSNLIGLTSSGADFKSVTVPLTVSATVAATTMERAGAVASQDNGPAAEDGETMIGLPWLALAAGWPFAACVATGAVTAGTGAVGDGTCLPSRMWKLVSAG